jgi:hypothetical protein
VTSWLKAKFGRMRVSTLVLVVAFVALFWVYHNFEPEPPPPAPAPAFVPPGFVPDPNYTWVPRTNVRRPKEPEYTTTTTTPTTTSPTVTTPTTTTPASPTPTTPTTTVIDPDGPGPLSPQIETVPPTLTPITTPPLGPAPATTAPPS